MSVLLKKSFTLIIALIFGFSIQAETVNNQLPDEYESNGGEGIALNESGTTVATGLGAVKINPSLIAIKRYYKVYADYHWPREGREYYQIGVVDSKTSRVAVGLNYTGYFSSYKNIYNENDSPINKRGTLSLAKTFSRMSAGISVNYVDAMNIEKVNLDESERTKGIGVGGGILLLLSPRVRVGASINNVTNTKIKNYIPKTYLVGGSYNSTSEAFSISLDYKKRERIDLFEKELVDLNSAELKSDSLHASEKLITSFIHRSKSTMLKLIGSYTYSLVTKENGIAGGIAIENKMMSLAFSASKPNINKSKIHNSITVSLMMSM